MKGREQMSVIQIPTTSRRYLLKLDDVERTLLVEELQLGLEEGVSFLLVYVAVMNECFDKVGYLRMRRQRRSRT